MTDEDSAPGKDYLAPASELIHWRECYGALWKLKLAFNAQNQTKTKESVVWPM